MSDEKLLPLNRELNALLLDWTRAGDRAFKVHNAEFRRNPYLALMRAEQIYIAAGRYHVAGLMLPHLRANGVKEVVKVATLSTIDRAATSTFRNPPSDYANACVLEAWAHIAYIYGQAIHNIERENSE